MSKTSMFSLGFILGIIISAGCLFEIEVENRHLKTKLDVYKAALQTCR